VGKKSAAWPQDGDCYVAHPILSDFVIHAVSIIGDVILNYREQGIHS
jgi:hypothetical protein